MALDQIAHDLAEHQRSDDENRLGEPPKLGEGRLEQVARDNHEEVDQVVLEEERDVAKIHWDHAP